MSQADAFEIRSLLTPAAFPHPVQTLGISETHVSWIVLTGPFAYKIKKPVRLDFLDASTLERRRFLCEEELRLNRRFAAELYVDVVPIVRVGTTVRVGGAGTPIEYAVRMKQFGAHEELASLLERNEVTAEQIGQLARLLADFHARAPRAEVQSQLAQRIVRTLLKNLTELESAAQPLTDRGTIEALTAWMRERIARDRELLEERAHQGRIRECHGDLHAGNVVRYRERLLPFDCIEFDPDLRWIDVIDDVAFLVMDIASHDRDDLAFTLLNTHLEIGGDYSGLAVLPTYAVHRALVRAKVDARAARTVPNRRDEFAARFERRLKAARAWAQPRRPLLVLMHGASGSGKSWLAERLAPRLPAIRIRSDVERKRLAGLTATESAADRVNSGLYAPQFTQRTYGRLRTHAQTCMRSGFSVIVDATFLDPIERRSFTALAQRLGAPVAIVACEAPPDVLAQRIRERARSGDRTSDADLAVLKSQLESMQPPLAEESGLFVRAQTSAPDVVEQTLRALQERIR